MKQRKSWLSLLLIFMLIFSVMGNAFAAEDTTSESSAPENSTETNKEQERNGITFDFDDSKEAPWAEEYIGKMQAKEVIKGYGDGTFKPNAPVTRIEAIVMAVRLMGLEEEALAKSDDVKLHFKDANQIPKWGRGHVIVALENGLFNGTEDKIQSNKPASRVWIVQLLVKALGFEQEALSQMTNIPDFEDVADIPAGSIGYVNVAVEQGITTGYGDNTFKPNQPVKRGEMAAFLDRTNDGLLENAGAITIQGIITAIEFGEETVSEDVYNETVTNDVYQSTDGSITIQTFTGDTQTYSISSNLLVQYHKRFVQADQLFVDDIVTLVVQDGQVIEANLVDEKEVNADSNLVELKVELEAGEEQKFKIKYKNKKGKVSGEIETKADGEKHKITGDKALSQVEDFISQLSLTPDMSKEEIVERVLAALEIEENKFKELEIEIKFSNGKKVEIEIENEGSFDEGYNGILEFEIKVELFENNKLKLKYKNKEGKVEAEVEKETKEAKEKYKGEEAVQAIESLLDELTLTEDMTEEEIVEVILAALGINQEDIKELEIKIKFTNDQEIEIEFENEDEEDEEDED
jgi:major membrane immunogen (membrane-anchored lipoprotein)